jgi:hypothetical protein
MATTSANEQRMDAIRGRAWSSILAVAFALTAACGVSDRKLSLADAGGSSGAASGAGRGGDAGPQGGGDSGSSSTAGSGAAGDAGGSGGSGGSNGSSGSSATCEPATFDESRFDEACFQ